MTGIWRTAIGNAEAESNRIRGDALTELMRRSGFTDVVFLLGRDGLLAVLCWGQMAEVLSARREQEPPSMVRWLCGIERRGR